MNNECDTNDRIDFNLPTYVRCYIELGSLNPVTYILTVVGLQLDMTTRVGTTTILLVTTETMVMTYFEQNGINY